MKDQTLLELRKQIDFIDQSIIELLDKRIEVVQQIGKVKRELNLPVINKNRENQVLEQAVLSAKHFKLKEYAKKIYRNIIMMCRETEGDL
jgi:monofunctional chorismate mutase